MTKFITSAFLTLLATTATAQTDKDWWACQHLEAAGLKWENGRWETTRFNPEGPFVLIGDGNGGLAKESVAKVFNGDDTFAPLITCVVAELLDSVSCQDETGNFLYFNKRTGNGGLTSLTGAAHFSGTYKPTPYLQAFECSKV